MKPRIKFIIGGVLVLGTASWLMASAIGNTGVYYLTPQELASRIARDTTFHETGVKLGARVVPGSIDRAAGGREVAFRVTDGVQEYRVVYRGIIPDTFTDSADVVVDGRLDREGTFHATTLLAKCGARFENAPPDAYRKVMQGARTS
jgi:cytochrome c-type biogenesis protein CcmE